MENHYFDENGVYIGSAPVGGEEFPPLNAIRVAPPERVGFCPVLNAERDGWDMVEDHRGEEGFLDCNWMKIAAVGPLPEGWSATPPPVPPDTRTPEQKRQDAYMTEADVYRDQALSYEVEAAACRLDGDLAAAVEAETKMNAALRLYRDRKEDIRTRYPDAGDERYSYSTSGTYHLPSCGYASENGELLTLADIAARNPSAKACGRCKPPALTAEGTNGDE